MIPRKLLGMLFIVIFVSCTNDSGSDLNGVVSGDLKQWHRITVTIEGPESGEMLIPNPFLDHRLDVEFTNGEKTCLVPGYYAADGNSAETGAETGNKWRAHFQPDTVGEWRYTAFFRAGIDVAVLDDVTGFEPIICKGSFTIQPTDKTGGDLRAQGSLRYVGGRYLRFAGTGEYFLKGGADSPENFLAYSDFDGTYDAEELNREGEARGEKFIHTYAPHAADWHSGDPVWKNGKGKNIIGALNYLASKGMNSVYFLTMNVEGDGKDVWPWTDYEERYRFDCSKLDQWEIVFSHMDKLGLSQYVVTQETENDQLLDNGELGKQRRLYYRELIARFAHHPALIWHLGEENTNTTEQIMDFCSYIRNLDTYDHPLVVHTFPGEYDAVYSPLLGFSDFEGVSLQTNEVREETAKWIERSGKAGKQWVAFLDEVAHADVGVKPDTDDYRHEDIRINYLWANLMSGGSGAEWYFGYTFPHNDLNCEDWRSRDHMWDMTRYALEFFRANLPFAEMSGHDNLVSGAGNYCLADPGTVYAVYLPNGGTADLNLGDNRETFSVRWFNPRTGNRLSEGTVTHISGSGRISIGSPPEDHDKDWVALIRNTEYNF